MRSPDSEASGAKQNPQMKSESPLNDGIPVKRTAGFFDDVASRFMPGDPDRSFNHFLPRAKRNASLNNDEQAIGPVG
jgi:hypothetical protein